MACNTAWRHHAVFTDAPLPLIEAEQAQRRHAVIEKVIADLRSGPLAHLPSASFAANSAWLVLAAIAFNLTRAAGSWPGVARPSSHRQRPDPAHHSSGADRSISPADHPATTDQLAMAIGVADPVHPRNRATRDRPTLTAASRQPDRRTNVEKAGHTGSWARVPPPS
jgi:hypothetical protein